MPWNLLIFPLAAGYYLLTRSYLVKFRQQRLDRYKLIFESVLYGTVISGAAYILRLTFNYFFPETFTIISESFPLKVPYTITALSTLVLSILFVEISNRFFLNEKDYIEKAIDDVGNEFELLMKASVEDKGLLLFTLSSQKCYVGWVKELPIPSVSNYVRIIPAVSGYRTDEMKLVFTSQYLEVYAQYIKEGKITKIDDLNTDLVIDLSNVISVSYFDFEVYQKFNKLEKNNKA